MSPLENYVRTKTGNFKQILDNYETVEQLDRAITSLDNIEKNIKEAMLQRINQAEERLGTDKPSLGLLSLCFNAVGCGYVSYMSANIFAATQAEKIKAFYIGAAAVSLIRCGLHYLDNKAWLEKFKAIDDNQTFYETYTASLERLNDVKFKLCRKKANIDPHECDESMLILTGLPVLFAGVS